MLSTIFTKEYSPTLYLPFKGIRCKVNARRTDRQGTIMLEPLARNPLTI
jgi:hypothetical protein